LVPWEHRRVRGTKEKYIEKRCILVAAALLAAAELPALTEGEVTALWASAGVGTG